MQTKYTENLVLIHVYKKITNAVTEKVSCITIVTSDATLTPLEVLETWVSGTFVRNAGYVGAVSFLPVTEIRP